MREASVCTFDTRGSKHRVAWRINDAQRLNLQLLMEQNPNSPKHALQFFENPSVVDATHAETQEGPCSALTPHTLRPHDVIMASTLACVVFWYFAASAAPVHEPAAADNSEQGAAAAGWRGRSSGS